MNITQGDVAQIKSLNRAEVIRMLNQQKNSESSFHYNSRIGKAIEEHDRSFHVTNAISPLKRACNTETPESSIPANSKFIIPKDLHIPFNITSGMELPKDEIAVAAYTFSTEKPLAEPLIDAGDLDHICSRQGLQSLAPTKYVQADYLAMVDMKNAEVVYVDSLPTRTTHRTQIAKIKKVMEYLEYLFAHPSFYETNNLMYPKVTQFKIIVPDQVPTQSNSYDCYMGNVMDGGTDRFMQI